MSWMKGLYHKLRKDSEGAGTGSAAESQGAPLAPPDGIREAALPAGVRIYAVGDIHGRADLLNKLQERILQDAAQSNSAVRKIVVYLGDYIDRGQQSREVLDLLLQDRLPGFQSIHLQGNHEAALLEFLEDASVGPSWFAVGGDATALSYGTPIPRNLNGDERYASIRLALRQSMPPEHLAFLQDLKLMFIAGDYVFVHAGLRPGIPLKKQSARDLLWIRDSFLNYDGAFEKVVVHGHSLSHQPELRENRIGVDTGAYATNVLTALVLEGAETRFIDTVGDVAAVASFK